jgi:TPP-dependent pyruvate/acetoin dehydrogenase alpha subunit
MPPAVGLGLAAKMQKQDSVTMCIFGDGGVGEGEFHESLNLAALWKVPVVWFCENNGYGMGVPLKDSLANDIFRLASGYNMPAIQVDGMDVIAVHEATKEAVKFAREGNGPTFIEAMTYRFRGHSMSDAELYRTKAEIEQYRLRDPILLLKNTMMDQGMLDDAGYQAIVDRVEREVDEAVQFAEASPPPSINTLFDHITKEPSNG